jgi:eukaryotic-like serine/threonine-protein kinase
MSSTTGDNLDREEQLNDILLVYVEAVQEGKRPDRRDLMARHPEFASELAEFFAGRDQLESLAAPLREVVDVQGAGPRRKSACFRGLDGAKQDSAGQPSGEQGDPPRRPAPGAETTELGQLGDFQLLREIGRGGMGIVYEAEQISLKRHVALKILPFAAAVDSKQLQRFKIEAQAAALLHHTNIVPVHAVGYERGYHYYAMQYIEGQSLATAIAELRQTSSVGQAVSAWQLTAMGQQPTQEAAHGDWPTMLAANGNAKTPSRTGVKGTKSRRYFRTVAELGVRAAEALEHAHIQGVVHRDVKPGNLLLDRHGQLWITDFGLAQLQGSTNLTRTGEIVGTLLYMSPEQAGAGRGMIDHRTDIYSLGVTLYELLTLQPLFASRDQHELLRHILSEEPVAPRSIDRTIPVELETIVLKAIAKNPAERYATAQELAEDLKRFLQDRPILARRPTLVDQVMKWGRRHRQMVLTTVLLLVSALGLSTIFIWRGHAATQAAYEREQLKSREAEENFHQAREAVNLLVQISEEELSIKPQCEGVRKRILEAALAYYQDSLEKHGDNPSIRTEFTAASKRVGEILAELATLQGPGQFQLLTRKDVQDDLHFSEAQKRKLDDLAGQFSEAQQEALKGLNKIRLAEQRKKLDDLARRKAEAINDLLTPQQANRLRQISMQDRFPTAFEDPDVVSALQLTKEQIERIREIRGAVVTTLVEYTRQNLDDQKLLHNLQEMWEARVEQIMGVLTSDQKASWSAMTGEPFERGLHSRRRMILRLLNLADR